MTFILLSLVFLVGLFLIGVPVAFALGITGLMMLLTLWGGAIDLGIIAQRMLYGANSFVMLAIPFFLLAGKLMNTGGVTQRIFDFANLLVGHLRGGLAQVSVIASMIFSGISGLAAAEAAGLGVVELKAMKDAGYDVDFSCGVIGAASTIGPIIPPSVPLVIYGVLANESIGRLLVGGIIPGFVVGLSLMIYIAFYARKKEFPRGVKSNLKELWQAFVKAFGALMTPAILVGGILTGVFTPTEAAAVSALYALILGVFVYRELTFLQVWKICRETARETATLTFILACAMFFGWVLIRSRAPIIILESFTSFSTNPMVILLILNIFFLIIGCFMETIAAMSILVPVLMPLLTKVGIDPLHFGLVMVLNLMIGLLTPPFGINLFILNKLSGVPTLRIAKANVPFFIPLLAALLLITVFPSLVTFLPTLAFGN